MPLCCAAFVGGLLYEGGADPVLVPEMQARRATFMDVYRTGTAPPAAPAVAGVPILIAEAYPDGNFPRGAAGDVPYTYTHTALIPAPVIDIRPGYNGGAWGFNEDNVWIPNQASGHSAAVVFVDLVQLEGSAAVYQLVYLRAYRPTIWPGSF
jgi:hypothetical protein